MSYQLDKACRDCDKRTILNSIYLIEYRSVAADIFASQFVKAYAKEGSTLGG